MTFSFEQVQKKFPEWFKTGLKSIIYKHKVKKRITNKCHLQILYFNISYNLSTSLKHINQ